MSPHPTPAQAEPAARSLSGRVCWQRHGHLCASARELQRRAGVGTGLSIACSVSTCVTTRRSLRVSLLFFSPQLNCVLKVMEYGFLRVHCPA